MGLARPLEAARSRRPASPPSPRCLGAPPRARLVARACHELRGPLTAADLALYAAARHGEAPPRGSPRSTAARRAELALTTSRRAPGAPRARPRRARAVGDLLADQALTWEVAWVFGCEVELVEPRPGAIVRGDRVRLTQAVGNLVANALEHGDGRVRLGRARQGDRVRIEVDDEGPGLPAPWAT